MPARGKGGEGGPGLRSAAAVAEKIKAVTKISQSPCERALRCSWEAAGSLAVIGGGGDNIVEGKFSSSRKMFLRCPAPICQEKKN